MADHHEVIDFGSVADHGRLDRAAVDAAICTQLDVMAQNDRTERTDALDRVLTRRGGGAGPGNGNAGSARAAAGVIVNESPAAHPPPLAHTNPRIAPGAS